MCAMPKSTPTIPVKLRKLATKTQHQSWQGTNSIQEVPSNPSKGPSNCPTVITTRNVDPKYNQDNRPAGGRQSRLFIARQTLIRQHACPAHGTGFQPKETYHPTRSAGTAPRQKAGHQDKHCSYTYVRNPPPRKAKVKTPRGMVRISIAMNPVTRG